MQQLFFEFIRCSVCNAERLSRNPSADEWHELFLLSKKHALTGIGFAGIQRLSKHNQKPPVELLLRWYALAESIKQRNIRLNGRCSELQRMISSEGIKSCILKGQCAAKYYAVANDGDIDMPSLRISGDIDIWLAGDRKSILDFVNRIHPTKHVIMQHAQLEVYDDVEVEIHFSPSELQSPLHNRRLQKWFKDQGVYELQLVENRFVGPSRSFDAIFMLSHIYKHLMAEGIGLRQLMDYYFLLLASKFSDDEKKDIMSRIKYFGMEKMASSVMWILKQVFVLPDKYMLCCPDERGGRLVLDEILKSGNFGHMDERRGQAKTMIGRLAEPRLLTWKLAKDHPLEYIFTPVNRVKQRVWMSLHGYTSH